VPSSVPLNYPSSRPDRGEAAQPISAGGIALPVARTWAWYLGCAAANARTTVISPRFSTPLLIWQFAFNWAQAASGQGGLSFFYSGDDAGGQTQGPIANKPPGTPILEPVSFRSSATSESDNVPEHFSMITEGGTVTLPAVVNMKKLVNVSGGVHLKVSLATNAALDTRVRGYVVVFEAASEEELLNFL